LNIQHIKLVIDNNTGPLKIVDVNGVFENIKQTLGMYRTAKSCHYIFHQDVDLKIVKDAFKFSVYESEGTSRNEWIAQVIRIYEGVNRVELEWLVGPVPIDDELGKEIVTKFRSTDSNGHDMIR